MKRKQTDALKWTNKLYVINNVQWLKNTSEDSIILLLFWYLCFAYWKMAKLQCLNCWRCARGEKSSEFMINWNHIFYYTKQKGICADRCTKSCALTMREHSVHTSLWMDLGYTSLWVMDYYWKKPWVLFWRGRLQVEPGSGEQALMVALGVEGVERGCSQAGTCTHTKNPKCISKNSPEKAYKKCLKATWEVMHILTIVISHHKSKLKYHKIGKYYIKSLREQMTLMMGRRRRRMNVVTVMVKMMIADLAMN